MNAKKTAPTVAEYVDAQLAVADRTLRAIAEELDIKSPNMLSMLRKGHAKIPLKMAPALAEAMRCDPKHFTMLCLKEYEPEVFKIINDLILNDRFIITENEQEIIELLREVNPTNPKIRDGEQRASLERSFELLA